MTYRIDQDAAGEWRWRLLARNHRIVADSGERYGRRGDCVRALRRVRGRSVVRGVVPMKRGSR